ncbi:MAG TPA: hypothetical protein VF972_00705, partial [Actinomycetota bacterium]
IGAGSTQSSHGRSLLGDVVRRAGLCAVWVGEGPVRGTPSPVGALITGKEETSCPGRQGGLVVFQEIAPPPFGPTAAVGPLLHSALALRAAPTLVIVLGLTPSPTMERAGDEVTGLVLATVGPGAALPSTGKLTSVTSDTTRQDGLVSNVDVAPTILRYFGIPIPSQMEGRPIRATEAPAPFLLHRLELEQRRTRLPVQFAELAFVVLAFLAGAWGLIKLSRAGTLSVRVRSALQSLSIVVVALPVALLAAGLLPRRSYAWTVPAILLSLGVLALGAERLRRAGGDPLRPFTLLGVVGLVLMLVDLSFAGPALRVPLFGGTMFDGVRYYGLPNGFVPMALGSGLLLAGALPPYGGFVALVTVGLAAGFPSLGADIGGSITLFVAAGLWLVLRSRRPLRILELAFVAAVAVVGLGVVLLANRFLPGSPTHATRFVEQTTGAPAHGFHVIAARLAVGARMIRHVPAAVLPLLGFVIILIVVVRRLGSVGAGMAVDARWPAIVITVCLAALVAYVVNDTGPAAADPAFVYAMAGITYPAMLATRRAGTPPAPPARHDARAAP